MARARIEEPEVQVNEQENPVIVEQNEEQQPEVKKPAPVVSSGKKDVKIHTTDEIDCLIACIPYKFAKDKDVTVPADVAAVLCYAKKAYRV